MTKTIEHTVPKRVYRFILSFSIVIIGTIIAWNANGRSLIGVDDANIYFVYMKHIAEGHGFVYTIGGEHVEGFTSLLWTMIGAGFHAMNLPLEMSLLIVNIVLISYVISRIWKFIDGEKHISWKSALFLSLLACTPGFIEWNVLSLLETGLWTTLLSLLFLSIIEDSSPWIIGILGSLLILCRPEAMLWGYVACMLYVIMQYRLRHAIQYQTSIPFFMISISLIALIVWRMNYFGFPLPNTYYAKVSSDIFSNAFVGLKYIAKFFIQIPIMAIVMIMIAYDVLQKLLKTSVSTISSMQWTIVIFAKILFIIPLLTGGDHFQLSRFFQSGIPLLLMGGIFILSQWTFHRSIMIGIVIIAMFSSRWVIYAVTQTPLIHEWSIAMEGRLQSQQLNAFFQENELPVQGVLTAGGMAYVYKGKTIDLLGLNNVEMAHAESIKRPGIMKNHASFVPSVFYDQQPDLFWMGGGFSDNEPNSLEIHQFNANIFHEIHKEAQFKDIYGAFAIQNEKGTWLMTFMSRRFIKSLDERYHIKEIPVREIPI